MSKISDYYNAIQVGTSGHWNAAKQESILKSPMWTIIRKLYLVCIPFRKIKIFINNFFILNPIFFIVFYFTILLFFLDFCKFNEIFVTSYIGFDFMRHRKKGIKKLVFVIFLFRFGQTFPSILVLIENKARKTNDLKFEFKP